jgi:hypothetical protein
MKPLTTRIAMAQFYAQKFTIRAGLSEPQGRELARRLTLAAKNTENAAGALFLAQGMAHARRCLSTNCTIGA